MIYFFVEGTDDTRFVEGVLKSFLEENGQSIFVWEYAQKKQEKVKDFIKSIQQMGAQIVFLTDKDEADQETKLQDILDRYHPLLTEDEINIVVKEIESWYVAGIYADELSIRVKSSPPYQTDDVSKEIFMSYFYTSSKAEIILDILAIYNLPLATLRNTSLKRVAERLNITFD